MTQIRLIHIDPERISTLTFPAMLFAIAAILTLFSAVTPTHAQLQHGDWTRLFEDRIDEIRKTDLRIIVLNDKDQPVPNVTVRIRQLSHAFPIGFVAGDPDNHTQPKWDHPLMNVFNSLSLERLSDWSRSQPTPETDPGDNAAMFELINAASEHNMTLRWGQILSADIGRNPDWLVPLHGQALKQAVIARIDCSVDQACRRTHQLDIYSYLTSHSMIEDRLGVPMLRLMLDHAKAECPELEIGLRFDDGLSGQRGNQVYKQVTTLHELQVNFDYVAIDQRYTGNVSHVRVLGGINRMTHMPVPVFISALEVGGDTMVDAAVNMDTILRLLFAQPNIHGIWFAGLYADQLADPNAAIIDDDNRMTAVGDVIQSLFHELWWSDSEETSNELGNVNIRIFPGRYHISAQPENQLPIETTLWLPQSPETHILVLQPCKE